MTRARRAANVFLSLASVGLFAARAFGVEPDASTQPGVPDASCGGPGPDTLDVVWVALPNEEALTVAACDWLREEKWRVRFRRASSVPLRRDTPASAVTPTQHTRNGNTQSGDTPSGETRYHVNPSGEARSVRLVVALDSPELARLYVDIPSGQRWVRDVPIEAGFGDASVEAIAQALHSVAQATQASEDAPRDVRPTARSPPLPRRPAASLPSDLAATPLHSDPSATPLPSDVEATPLPPEAASHGAGNLTPSTDLAVPQSTHPPSSGQRITVLTGLGYLIFLRGEEPPLHGAMLRLAVDGKPYGVPLGAYVSGVLFTSKEKELPALAVQTSGVSLGTGVSLRTSFTDFGIRARLGGGVDLVALDSVVRDPSALRLLPNRRARPRGFISGDIATTWRHGPLELELAALLRWQLLHTRYQARDGDEVLVLFEPWRLQPGLSASAAYVW